LFFAGRREHDAFKKRPKAERAAIATEAFIRSGMIDERGVFTDNDAYSREYYKEKKNGKVKA
jgi:hypothetical protein